MSIKKRILSLVMATALALPCAASAVSAEGIDEKSIVSADINKVFSVITGTKYEDALKKLPSTVTLKLKDASTAVSETLHTAKFEKSDWTLFDPSAVTFADGKIKINKQSTKVKALTGGEYENFILEVTLRGTAASPDNNFGVILRASNVTDANADSYQGYYVGIGRYGSKNALTVGYGSNAWKLIKTVDMDYKPNTDYKLKVLMYENTLAVWVDGKLFPEAPRSRLDG